MATVTQSYFNLLTDIDGDNITHLASKKTPTPWSADAEKNKNKKEKAAAAQKKQQTKPHAVTMQQAVKPHVAQDHRMMKPVIYHQRPKKKLSFEEVMQNNQQKEKAVETESLTLKEYGKELLQKKQALNAVWRPKEERKVGLDKDFESMKFLHKKNDDEVHVNAKTRKKDRQQNQTKVGNNKQKLVVGINGFLKPLGSGSQKHPIAANGGKVKAETTFSFEDFVQFPALE